MLLLVGGRQDLLVFADRRRIGAVQLGWPAERCRLFRLLFGFHPPILEPDLDLPFRQAQGVSDLDAPASCQVAIEVEFLLQFQRLVARVRLARPLGVRHHICNEHKKWNTFKSNLIETLEKKRKVSLFAVDRQMRFQRQRFLRASK